MGLRPRFFAWNSGFNASVCSEPIGTADGDRLDVMRLEAEMAVSDYIRHTPTIRLSLSAFTFERESILAIILNIG